MEAVDVMVSPGRRAQSDSKAEEKARVLDSVKNSTASELDQIRFMRALVEAQDPSVKMEVIPKILRLAGNDGPSKITLGDDYMIRRFLRARDLDIEKASAMFLKYLKWRHSFVPNGSISVTAIPNEIAQNKMFMQGLGKKGRPVTIVLGAKHFENKHSLDEFKRFVVYALDKICARMPEGQEEFVAIVDLKGWGYSNSDIRGYLSALTILQEYYPERLGKLFVVHAPYISMAVWKIIYPFIDDNIKKKIVFVEKNKIKATLLEEIDESQIPEIYGGQLPLVPIQDS